MIRRVATLLVAVAMSALTSAAPAVAGGSSSGTTVVPTGIIHCC
jgi:hypothetical protein